MWYILQYKINIIDTFIYLVESHKSMSRSHGKKRKGFFSFLNYYKGVMTWIYIYFFNIFLEVHL